MSLADPAQDSGQGDDSQKRGCELLMAGGDAPVPFQRTKEVLNPMALAVIAAVKRATLQPFSIHRKARENVQLPKA